MSTKRLIHEKLLFIIFQNNDMKKIISLFLITVFSLLFTTGSLAIDIQNTTNSANKTPPTPQKLIDKQIQNLKDKIATKVAELSKSNQQVLSGMISKIDKSSLSIQSKPSTKIFIDSEATAFINGINQKNKLTIDDITVSDYVVIFGVMLGDEFTAKSIIKQNQTEFIEGTIKNVEKNGYYIEIITADQETIIVDIEKNSRAEML